MTVPPSSWTCERNYTPAVLSVTLSFTSEGFPIFRSHLHKYVTWEIKACMILDLSSVGQSNSATVSSGLSRCSMPTTTAVSTTSADATKSTAVCSSASSVARGYFIHHAPCPILSHSHLWWVFLVEHVMKETDRLVISDKSFGSVITRFRVVPLLGLGSPP